MSVLELDNNLAFKSVIIAEDTDRLEKMFQENDEGVDLVSNWGCTPLCAAAADGYTKSTHTLLQYGASPSYKKKKNNSPFLKAVMNGHNSTTEIMLKQVKVDIEVNGSCSRRAFGLTNGDMLKLL